VSLPRLKTLRSETPRPYLGPELRPHFLLSELKVEGSAVVAFTGPCHVETGHLVDWEDRLALDRIEARSMVHFLGEFFGLGLREGVLLQRLFISVLADTLRDRGVQVKRDGDDLFARERKLSVSIVTVSGVSLLLHAGINIDPAGAPVPAIGLQELGVEPNAWIDDVLARFQREWDGMDWACVKVRPVM
jgi:hypothetical protein